MRWSMRIEVVFWVVGIKVGMIRFGPSSGLIPGWFGSGVAAKRNLARAVMRDGSITFSFPLYVIGCARVSLRVGA